MRPVSPHFLNLSMVDPQGFGVERAEQEHVEQEHVEQERMEREWAEQEQVEWEQVEQERAEREQLEREWAEQEQTEQERQEQEQEFLFRRLKPVEAGYRLKSCCMDSTRQSLLNHIVDWA